MNIGAAIKKLRLARKLTQEELAEHANTSKPNISNLERNAQGFSPVILSSLGKALGVKVSEIFQLAEEIGELESGKSANAKALAEDARSNLDQMLALYKKLPAKKQAALLRFLKTWADES